MDSDQVNSVSDTTESLQVLALLKTCYFDLVSNGDIDRDYDLYQLQASGDSTKPVTMFLPATVNNVQWVKYDYQTLENPHPNFQIVKPVELYDFITMATNLNPTDTNVTTYTLNTNGGSFTLYCRNDVPPQYYTSTNDNQIVFDAYDQTVDTTLQASKTMVFGQQNFPWSDTDNFVPPLDDQQSQQLLHMLKALAFAELKQTPHVKAEKAAKDIEIMQQSTKHKVLPQTYQNTTYDFGRRPTGRTKPTGRYK
jgi:hypothetical protein